MPLTQEKRMDNFPNNNDHTYLHKKFKKMASPISVLPNSMKSGECEHKEIGLAQIISPSLTNGTISAAQPEIEINKEKYTNRSMETENIVQTNYNDENCRLSGVNNFVQISGKTSYNDEFLNKTENIENDVTKDTYSGGTRRYICPYCKLPYAKPSVLQKHIRAHTNERPYPCIPCGFAFKTKSNLYKHKRSRTHALRLQGADVTVAVNDEDLSGGSESDTSTTPTSLSDPCSDASLIRFLNTRPNDVSSPELTNDGNSVQMSSTSFNDIKSKTIYKPKFRAAFYQGSDDKDKIKKSISHNADFLTEHISKIISDNEAIVDVIETPLQKKYGKIKQIAESKQFTNDIEIKSEASPLNLTKNYNESDSLIRKRSHSESFALTAEDQKHPLNPEGSIIKDLLLKTKANGLNMATNSLTNELVDGLGPLYVCSQCQIVYRSADNLEIHRSYYCKGGLPNNSTLSNNIAKDGKYTRPDNLYVRSNSINVRLPENTTTVSKVNYSMTSPPMKNKPDNLVILKTECSDVATPLPSPGPLLGKTRLVDTRFTSDFNKKAENLRFRSNECSPRRRFDSRSETNSPRLSENISPRSAELYTHPKKRCIDINSSSLRTIEEISPHIRHNSTSLQMFGGEVKIVDHSGSTTTLRIEPSKTQLSPILIHPNLSPSKYANDTEASSVVVRSGLHSGGTIVHNPPTPKETISNHQVQTPRISTSTSNVHGHDIPHFQFPPLSAITAYNPLTLPPLSPSPSPNGATTILHGGKLIPHVPGIPGPNTPGLFTSTTNMQVKGNDSHKSVTKTALDNNQHSLSFNLSSGKGNIICNYDRASNNSRSPNFRSLHLEVETHNQNKDSFNNDIQNNSSVPIIKIKHVDEPMLKSFSSSNVLKSIKRTVDGLPKMPVLKENLHYSLNKGKNKDAYNQPLHKFIDIKAENDIKNFNFENIITKAEIYNNQIQSSCDVVQGNCNISETFVTSIQNERSETSYFQKSIISKSISEDRKPKFLRPSTLPLKPGTFTPKRHHGITPNANTMPLVSPETPRPSKAYGQLYLNGNAYTYLGLKCSTKVFYCTINRPQPTYVPNQHFLSMYSNWQLLSELTPDPLGLSASSAMSLYDSRHRPQSLAVSVIKQDLILTHSSQWNKNSKDGKQALTSIDAKKSEEIKNISDNTATSKKELTGGFESNEEYTYVRGRGRGRYVCSECGIRCKKPSMLKKHIRTHTDVRPYTCVHCVFSFKTKGNLTKHMKSKAHYKKCCELGINPNEGTDGEGSEMTQCSGETDDETDSEGDEGNEGETESSDTEVFKSRLPEHEAAHCLLSLGGSRPSTSATPGLITSARPTTYPYSPMLLENMSLDVDHEKIECVRTPSTDSRIDIDNEPMDLSKNEVRTPTSVTEIPTERESSVMACLASNTAKLPHHQSQWANGEPMLHTYLTERALLDSKIKQSQLTCNSKIRKIELENSLYNEKDKMEPDIIKLRNIPETVNLAALSKDEPILPLDNSQSCLNLISESRARTPSNSNPENAKHVVSEYLKHARINHMKTLDDPNHPDISSDDSNSGKINTDEKTKLDDVSDGDGIKLPSSEYDAVASKVVIGVGGVAFKVTKGKDFEGSSSYSPGKLMEDGRRVCDFCNKTFTKPSQLRLHLNIHYMERPFRCSVCAVSFRTRGHLQKHERSGSHHNKVSMTSTFGAATSCNPRPFRCSDCNIAFRIHGHLAKHLRSKMHVMRLECLFKLPFGTFTEIERAGLSLTDIDTTDCASSLASLQSLARKLHEKDPSKLEYREPSAAALNIPAGRESSEDEDALLYSEKTCESLKDSEIKTIENGDCQETETRVNYSATDI